MIWEFPKIGDPNIGICFVSLIPSRVKWAIGQLSRDVEVHRLGAQSDCAAKYSSLNGRILIINTPRISQVPLIFGNSYMSASDSRLYVPTRTQGFLSIYIVECRVSIVGTTIMIWETIPHNQYLGPFGSTLHFLILGSLGALASACYIIQGPNYFPIPFWGFP